MSAGEFYARLTTYGVIMDMRRIRDTWPELPNSLDAVMSTSRYVYFFKVSSHFRTANTVAQWCNG